MKKKTKGAAPIAKEADITRGKRGTNPPFKTKSYV